MFVYTEYRPSPPLWPFIHSYGCFAALGAGEAPPPRRGGDDVMSESTLGPEDPLVEWVVPGVHVMLNFNLGAPYTLCREGGDLPVPDVAHVIGPATRPGRMLLPDRLVFFGVCFRPGRAGHFLRVPADELTDRSLDLGHVWGAAGRALGQRLLGAADVRERIRLVEAELLRRLAAPRPADRLVPALADQIVRRRGLATVRGLSAASGLTRQHLARKFRQALGVSPKLFCRLVRFENTMARAATPPPPDWAAAALELGYYDQAHLIAEFKEFTGLTPAAFTSLR